MASSRVNLFFFFGSGNAGSFSSSGGFSIIFSAITGGNSGFSRSCSWGRDNGSCSAACDFLISIGPTNFLGDFPFSFILT